MTDDDRFRLLFGPYRTPVFRYGDAFCELRGDVILCGLTDAPIPWPTGKKRQKGPGARAIVVYGALAEAVRRESAQAVAHWWGIARQAYYPRCYIFLVSYSDVPKAVEGFGANGRARISSRGFLRSGGPALRIG